MFLRDNPTQQQALGFLIAQTTYIEPQVYRLKYPELNYAELIPVDSSANEWAKSITFFSVDMIGAADWFNSSAADVPLADIARAKHEGRASRWQRSVIATISKSWVRRCCCRTPTSRSSAQLRHGAPTKSSSTTWLCTV